MKGFVYAIRSHQTTKVYYGSTIQSIDLRFAGHRYSYKRWLSKPTNYTASYEIMKYPDAYVELVEEVEFENKKELSQREDYYILQNDCVNKEIKIDSINRTDYMRDYMRNRYNSKIEECRAEQNTRRLKSKSQFPQDEVEFYGVHLADVVKLKKLWTAIPPEMVKKALNL